jgi:hypothetical protein
MAARKRTLRKQSAASSTSASLPEAGPVFFLDRDLGKHDVAGALRSLGASVVIHAKHFLHDEKDADWLVEVGRRGWAILTRDKHILTRPLEVVALLNAHTHVFVLKSRRELNGPQMAAAFAKAYKQMCRLIASKQSPFLARVTAAGQVSEIEGYRQIQDRIHRSQN